MCEWFDETCGDLLEYLDAKKLTENTVVIYNNVRVATLTSKSSCVLQPQCVGGARRLGV
jgi:hypothetical protein